MNVGIDIDDTIACTSETIKEYLHIYAKGVKTKESDIWNIKENKIKFLEAYLEEIYINAPLKQNVEESFKELQKNGCKLYIITARTESYVDNIQNIIREYLSKYNLTVEAIFINAKDKVDACKNNNIDIMIDDNLYNYYMLTQNNITAILFDDKNKYNIIEDSVQGWPQIVEIIKNMLKRKTRVMKDEAK